MESACYLDHFSAPYCIPSVDISCLLLHSQFYIWSHYPISSLFSTKVRESIKELLSQQVQISQEADHIKQNNYKSRKKLNFPSSLRNQDSCTAYCLKWSWIWASNTWLPTSLCTFIITDTQLNKSVVHMVSPRFSTLARVLSCIFWPKESGREVSFWSASSWLLWRCLWLVDPTSYLSSKSNQSSSFWVSVLSGFLLEWFRYQLCLRC